MKIILPLLVVLLSGPLLHADEPAKPKSPPKQNAAAKANRAKEAPEKYDASVPAPTHAGVKYGPHARNVLDFWQAKSDKPTPLVLAIHGGGWTGGSKERVHRFVDVKALLDAGISVAANNYRMIPQAVIEGVEPPVKAPMQDSARTLQFIRNKAADWNIDPERVAAAGGSAGACTSLWLAYHDDMADPKSADPIARQSTRLVYAAVIGAQTTLDPKEAKEWIPNSSYGGHAYGKKTFAQALAERESLLPWIKEYSPYALSSKDDPPVAIFYSMAPAMGKDQKDPTHSANFGIGLQRRCAELGIGCEVIAPVEADSAAESATAYLIKFFAPKK
ncbi:MAG: alpha/beta hydrolase fold domain-containing protein [Verrucomicrobiales bacterium]